MQARIFAETNELAGSTTESLRNIELIKSLGLETQEIERLNRTNTRILGLELSKVKTVRVLMFAQGTAINFFRALLLAGMLVLMYFKLITLGEFFSIMFYSFAIFAPLGELGTIITRWQETRASLANVERLLAEEPAPVNPDGVLPSPVSSIAFEGVTYRHPAARDPALQDVSFSVASGQSIAFVGPSGAGKSTLVKLLLGLYRPDVGAVRVQRHSIRRRSTTTGCAGGWDSYRSRSTCSRAPSGTTCSSRRQGPPTRTASRCCAPRSSPTCWRGAARASTPASAKAA